MTEPNRAMLLEAADETVVEFPGDLGSLLAAAAAEMPEQPAPLVDVAELRSPFPCAPFPSAISPAPAHAETTVRPAASPTAEAEVSPALTGTASSIPSSGSHGPWASQELLARLADGVAIVGSDLHLLWFNPAFANLCPQPPTLVEGIYHAMGCKEIEGPNFCPFTDCLGGEASARTRLRLQGGRHVEMIVQPLDDPSSDDTRLLCCVRDVTSEVKQREKLIAIHRAGLELSHLTPEELARMSTAERIDLLKANIIQYSKNILSFKNIEIRLLAPGTKRLDILLSEGIPEEALLRELRAEVEGNGVTGYVAATGASYLCDDVAHDPHYLPGVPNARSSLTVPIVYRDRVIGTCNVESPESGRFTESDREFLEIFAREIAVALNNLELLQAEKRFAGFATVEAIVNEVSLPADEIVADTIQLLDLLREPVANRDAAREALRRVLQNARTIKGAIQTVGREVSPMAEPSLPQPTAVANRKVLLADNDPTIRRCAHRMLGQLGCEVDTVKCGQEALCLAGTIEYELVLGDIRLPDMNGYEFFSRIRELLPQVPIVLMTGFGYDGTHSLVKARQDGLRAVLYKPFRIDRLCEAINDAMNPQVHLKRDGNRPLLATKQSILS